jgi:2-oxoglutarate dehydrogenase E2 component (dihydrolipoamide succinyltransferase)
MTVEVKVNELPESVSEGTLVLWHKQPGDAVSAGETLAEIETDKVVLEIAAPSSGTLRQQLRKKGEPVKRGDAIASIEPSAGTAEGRPANPQPPPAAMPAPTVAKMPSPVATPAPKSVPASTKMRNPTPAAPAAKPASTEFKAPTAAPVLSPATAAQLPTEPAAPADGEKGADAYDGLSPSVRRLLQEHRLAPSDITPSGPRGRITKEDVLRHLANSPQLAANIGEAPIEVALARPGSPATAPGSDGAVARPTSRVKMSRLRARIAERMLEAQRSAAILTTFNQVNMQAVMDLRRTYKDAFEAEHGAKLGIMGFFVRACTEALRRHPIVNASVDGEEIVYHGYFDIGVAVSTSRGLVVPVLRDADRMGLAEIERTIADLSRRGEEGKLGIHEITGGTFTISNGGVFGSMLSTPILNPPQSAILGLHRIEPRPVAEGDRVVIRPMMYLALSYDHRIIDGKDAVLFLVAVKELIEDPTRFILKV